MKFVVYRDDLYNEGAISYEEALRNADSMNELRLQIKLKSNRQDQTVPSSAASFSMLQDKDPEENQAKTGPETP